MSAIQIIFNAVSQLTGGLINDLTTAIIGMVVIGFIAMGIDHIIYVLNGVMDRRSSEKYLERAKLAKDSAISHGYGSVESDYNMALYRRYIRKSADAAERGWR